MDEAQDNIVNIGTAKGFVQGDHATIYINEGGAEWIDWNTRLTRAYDLRLESFKLGDADAAKFPYIIAPIKNIYETAIRGLNNAATAKSAKHGILIFGESNAGKTRLALEIVRNVLPTWPVLRWMPDYTMTSAPPIEFLKGKELILFIDDLQDYATSPIKDVDGRDLILSSRVMTLRTLVETLLQFLQCLVIVATCRIEDRSRAITVLNWLLIQLTDVTIPSFDRNEKAPEAEQIIALFQEQGVIHEEDWDGTLGSLVLGLSTKNHQYLTMAESASPAAAILRAMKLLSRAKITLHTERRIRAVCAGVFGEKLILNEESSWQKAIDQLTKMQFVLEEADDSSQEMTLVIRKDSYFEKVINDYPPSHRPHLLEQDIGKLQKVLIELKDVHALLNLGLGYREKERYEEAIVAFRHALDLEEKYFRDTISLLNIYFCLANAYIDRRTDERRVNIEQAIFYFKAALEITTREALFDRKATLQVLLGNAYRNRIEGEREENLKHAISCYDAASEIFIQERVYQYYAWTQVLIAETYEVEVVPGRLFDAMMAIRSYSKALAVFTIDAFPKEFAQTMWQLGNVFLKRTGLERRDNIEKAIACYNAALHIFTLAVEPSKYATITMNLGIAYAERIMGTLQENKEKSIFFLERAVQAIPPDTPPEEKIMAFRNLGNGYLGRSLGDVRTNLEKAVAAYEEALQFCPLDKLPEKHAMVQLNLGNAYIKRIEGVRRVNLEKAIRCYEIALQVYTRNTHPLDYGLTQSSLGSAYQKRIEGEARTNIEQAISHYEAALEVYTPFTYPHEHATIMSGLCQAYLERIEGDQRGNIERVILCCMSTFFSCTSEAFPEEWASIRYCLGMAYMRRTAGERSDNLERSITYYREVLEVYTSTAFPQYYANIQTHLAMTYKDRVKGERDENLELALACQNAALQIYTRDDFPADYAHLQYSRGNIYLERMRGERTDNLNQAIACYEEALQTYTLEAFPRMHRLTHIGLALAEGERQNWAEVHAACTRARRASELLVRLASGEVGRDAALKENLDSVQYDSFALAHLGRLAEAAVALEQGRAQGLAEALKLKTANPERISNPERRHRYQLAHRQFVDTQSALHSSFSADIPRNERRNLLMERAEAYRKAKEHLEEVLTEIQIANDPADFVNDTFDETAILKAAESLGTGHALVYLVSTPWGGMAVAAFSANPSLSRGSHFSALDLPHMTDIFAHELIQIELGPRTDQIIGGFIHAQLGNGLSLLSDREWLATHEEPREGFAVLAQGWEDETFRQRAISLHEHCKVSNQASSLNKAAQAILNNPALTTLVDQSLREMKDEEKNILANTLDHYFLSEELQVSLNRLSTYVLSPLLTWLREQGTTSLTFIPCGWLAASPLAAVSLNDGRTLGETIPTSSAPSARSLLQNKQALETNRSGVYAMGDPRPTHQELPWGEAEALTIAKLARAQKLGGQARVQEKATRRWFSDALRLGRVVDASCHGSFDSSNFLQSALHLAGGYALPLETLLSHEVDLQGLRLMILSACKTAIADLGGAREEVRSLASGMLQAGAKGVLAALWSVDDHATYLLMVRFAQEWFPKINDEPPAAALARAQFWLRTVTNRELLTWQATNVPMVTNKDRQEAGAEPSQPSDEQDKTQALVERKKLEMVRGRGNRYMIDQAVEEVRHEAGREIDLDACPYADPIYWAAFQVTGW